MSVISEVIPHIEHSMGKTLFYYKCELGQYGKFQNPMARGENHLRGSFTVKMIVHMHIFDLPKIPVGLRLIHKNIF
jgi:hypothetical protein